MSEKTTLHHLKIRRTYLRMSGGFTFNLSSGCISVLLGNLNIQHKLFAELTFPLSSFRNALEGLVKFGVMADSTQGTLVCTAKYQGAGT